MIFLNARDVISLSAHAGRTHGGPRLSAFARALAERAMRWPRARIRLHFNNLYTFRQQIRCRPKWAAASGHALESRNGTWKREKRGEQNKARKWSDFNEGRLGVSRRARPMDGVASLQNGGTKLGQNPSDFSVIQPGGAAPARRALPIS